MTQLEKESRLRVPNPLTYWTDHKGNSWRVVRSSRRLKFKYPAHAALRAFVFHRDGFTCVRCGVKAVAVPADYNGANALWTNSKLKNGWPDMLVADHILTLRAGGTSTIDNLQTLCETCNRRKLKEDLRAYEASLSEGASK